MHSLHGRHQAGGAESANTQVTELRTPIGAPGKKDCDGLTMCHVGEARSITPNLCDRWVGRSKRVGDDAG